MQIHIYYLTPDENLLLTLMAQDFSTRHILKNCPIPLSGFHIFCAEVRRKLGLVGRLVHELRPFLERYNAAMANPFHPTPDQKSAVRHYLDGNTASLQLPPYALQSLIDELSERVGIFTRDERARKAHLRLYMAIFHFNGKPLTPLETQILRGMAEGLTFEEISDSIVTAPILFLKGKAKEACQRLYFDAQGRNAQRTLLRAYFAWIDAHKTDPMDDPLF
jgi:hypothetical protein